MVFERQGVQCGRAARAPTQAIRLDTVEKLTESREGKIGLWLGDESDGQFANLKITSKK